MKRIALLSTLCLFAACGVGAENDPAFTEPAQDSATSQQELVSAVKINPTSPGLFGGAFWCAVNRDVCVQNGGSAQQCQAQYAACIAQFPPSQR